MGKSSRKTRTTSRPARRAARSTEAVSTPIETAASAAPSETIPETPAVEAAPAADAAAVDAPAAPVQREVAQLAFRYFAESGYEHGHALDHWLRAETELGRDS
jgi:hypothetical protein